MSDHFPAPLAGLDGQAPPAPDWFNAALAQAPERLEQRVQGAPLEVLAWGRVGDPGVLLLHGNGAHADWYSFIAPLLLPGRRVVAMSFSGMGRSGWRTQYSVSQWADEALEVAQATGLMAGPGAPVVVGHSFGGFVTLNLAARHGAHFGRALVVDAPLRPPGRDQRAHRPDIARAAAAPGQRGAGAGALSLPAAAGLRPPLHRPPHGHPCAESRGRRRWPAGLDLAL